MKGAVALAPLLVVFAEMDHISLGEDPSAVLKVTLTDSEAPGGFEVPIYAFPELMSASLFRRYGLQCLPSE